MAISDNEWQNILKYYGDSTHVAASPVIPYCAFATVDEDGTPRVAPYTSLILGDNRQGFYFDEQSRRTTLNLDRDERLCILIVKTNKLFWIKSILFSRFDHTPGVRLIGRVGKKRKATEQEIRSFKRPLKRLRLLKGYEPVWGFMKYGRDIYFDAFEPVKCRTISEIKPI